MEEPYYRPPTCPECDVTGVEMDDSGICPCGYIYDAETLAGYASRLNDKIDGLQDKIHDQRKQITDLEHNWQNALDREKELEKKLEKAILKITETNQD